jgi:hypothetical protein
LDKGEVEVKVLVVLAAVCAALAVTVSSASAQSAPVVPSQARAIHDVKKEILDHWVNLISTSNGNEMTAGSRISCGPLTDSLWRCEWLGRSPLMYTVFGKAKVRFYKYATDVHLYDVKCLPAPGSPMDFCALDG